MVTFLSHSFPCNFALLEYSESSTLEDFDLAVPLTLGVLQGTVKEKYPDLLETLSKISSQHPVPGIILDKFETGDGQPTVVTYCDPKELLDELGLEASILEDKQYYATAIYLGRDNLIRVIYRNPEDPKVKTDVHLADGTFSHHEYLYQGSLPESLSWANARLKELQEAGVNAKINHYKDLEENSKVYFHVQPN